MTDVGAGLHTTLGIVDQPNQEFDICSLAENTRAILVGRGWAVPGFWCWSGTHRHYIDCSRPTPERVPSRDNPSHWMPLKPIAVAGLKPSPAFASPPEVVGDGPGCLADTEWPYRYAPAGAISRDEVEHRVLRGLKTSRAPGIVKEVRLGVKINWPVHEIIGDRWDYASPIEPRAFEPNRRDRDDWHIALGWLNALYPPNRRPKDWRPGDLNTEQKLVVWKSWGYTWRTLGERAGRSHEWARRRYKHAIDIVAAAANGPGGSVRVEIEREVRERQMAWQARQGGA